MTVFLLCLSLVVTKPAVAQEGAEETILIVQAGRHTLSQGILAYEQDGAYYLPLVALSDIFGFHSHMDHDRQSVTGWSMREDNVFLLDIHDSSLHLGGQVQALPDGALLPEDHGPASFFPMEGEQDIYVRIDVVNLIWDIGLVVDPAYLSLTVTASGKLPFLQRAERQERYNMAVYSAGEKEADKNPQSIANKYRLYGLPVLDLEGRTQYDQHKGGFGGRVSLGGVQDLLWMSAHYTAIFGYDQGKNITPDSIRLRFDRDAGVGGPLPFGLQHIELGDTRIRHAALIKNSTYGRGFLLGSAKRKRDNSFDVTTVEGDAPPGWDAELYRNGNLLAFSTIDEKGEYRFENIELNFGENIIRVVLYGPQGQTREIVENYSFGSSMLAPGVFNYTLGMVDAEKELIPLDKATRSRLSAGRDVDGIAANMDIAYGFNRYITGYAGFAVLPADRHGDGHNYISAGLASSLPFGALQVEAYQEAGNDDDTGRALDTRFITTLKGVRINLRNRFYSGGFESPDAGYGDAALQRETEIGLQKNSILSFGTLGLNIDYTHSRYRNGYTLSKVTTRQSLGYKGFRLTHRTQSYFGAAQESRTTGQLGATVRVNKIRLRTGLDYDMIPDQKIRAFDGEVFYRQSDKLSASLLARHDFPTQRSGAGFQVNYHFDHFIGSFETLWDQQNGAQMVLRASTALGPYGNDGSYIMAADRLAGAAAVKARVFLDRNGDGVYDAGDIPLDNAQIRVNGRRGKERSDKEGMIVNLSGAGVEDSVIRLDRDSLQDPYHIPAHDGYRTSLRPGALPRFDFPVVETGAIDGTAYLAEDRPAQGLRLELLDRHDRVIQETQTAFDGFYSFEYVPVGTYRIRPAAGQMVAGQDMSANIPEQLVEIAGESFFMSGVDLQGNQDGPHSPMGMPSLFASPRLETLDVDEGADTVRLVLALSTPSSYQVRRTENGRVIFIDFPDIALSGHGWQALRKWRGSPDAVLSAYDVEPLEGGGTRLKLSGKRPIMLEEAASGFAVAGIAPENLAFQLVYE